MGVEDSQYALPADLDTYMQESIFHMLGFCSSEEQLQQTRVTAEQSYRDLTLQMQHVQMRLRELEQKRSKSKEEAVLNAQALKRQVAECQKLTEQCRLLKEECTRVEQECALYHNDRNVFMEAAYEAEDRAAEAEDRAAKVEKQYETTAAELERVRQMLAQDSRSKSLMDESEHVASLKSRISDLENHNARLQEEISVGRCGTKQPLSAQVEGMLAPPDTTLQALLLAANERYMETRRELSILQETYRKDVASRKDEQEVHQMVYSAVTAGMFKALEEEKDASLSKINLEFSSIFRRMESELAASRDRVKFAEMNVQALLLEVHELRQEAALCRGNLDKAEVEVQMLADENKELRVLLRRRYTGSESPVQNKGNKGGSQSGGRLRNKTREGYGDESICLLCSTRQPLMPLSANSVERKLSRRQNLTVDGNFCSRSSSCSATMDLSPGS